VFLKLCFLKACGLTICSLQHDWADDWDQDESSQRCDNIDVGSLGILHRSIPIAHESESFWIRLQAFMGPGALVAVITAHEIDFLIYLCDTIEL